MHGAGPMVQKERFVCVQFSHYFLQNVMPMPVVFLIQYISRSCMVVIKHVVVKNIICPDRTEQIIHDSHSTCSDGCRYLIIISIYNLYN